MEHIQQVSERIAKLVPGASHPVDGVRYNIMYFVDDVLKMVKNIEETSLSGEDKRHRYIQLSNKTGIAITSLVR